MHLFSQVLLLTMLGFYFHMFIFIQAICYEVRGLWQAQLYLQLANIHVKSQQVLGLGILYYIKNSLNAEKWKICANVARNILIITNIMNLYPKIKGTLLFLILKKKKNTINNRIFQLEFISYFSRKCSLRKEMIHYQSNQ